MKDGRYIEKNRKPDRRSNHMQFCIKGKATDFSLLIGLFAVLMISFGIWLTILPPSLAAQVTMDVYQTSGNKVFGNTTSLDIFKETAVSGEPILHPGSAGSYTFAVYNNSGSSSLPYSLTFETENKYNIPIVVTIQKNTEYIFGSDNAMAALTTCRISDMMLKGTATDYYTINWKWLTTSDEADTALGEAAKNKDMWYTLTITAAGELNEVSSDSVTAPVTPLIPSIPGITRGSESFRESVQEMRKEMLAVLDDILVPGGRIGGLSAAGDSFNIMAWATLAGVSFAGIVLLLLIKRKRKDDGEVDENSSENN